MHFHDGLRLIRQGVSYSLFVPSRAMTPNGARPFSGNFQGHDAQFSFHRADEAAAAQDRPVAFPWVKIVNPFPHLKCAPVR